MYTSANVWESSQYYMRDAQGNVMSIYKKENVNSTLSFAQTERPVYGSSRLGQEAEQIEMLGAAPVSMINTYTRTWGDKQYEGSNHLGNVLAVFTDKKIPRDDNADGTVDYYQPELIASNDYSAFGVLLYGRNFSSSKYRYGFNGMEKDDEVKGSGNSYDFSARIYDPRIGRWLAIDPKFKASPSNSAYNFVFNQPIIRIDPDGKYPYIVITTEVTGYTIARLDGKDVSSSTYTPALVVPTYKAVLYDINEKGQRVEVQTFNVIRDGWYSLGEIKKDGKGTGELSLINRAFEPKNGKKNLFTGVRKKFPAGTDHAGYTLTQYKSSSVDAEGLSSNTHLDGTPIDDSRPDNSKATGVMLHIGGTYNASMNWDWLATSYGCFGFIPDDDIYKTPEEAKTASENDDYDDVTSDASYKIVTDKIDALKNKETSKDRKKLLFQVNKRTNYQKTKTIKKSDVIKE